MYVILFTEDACLNEKLCNKMMLEEVRKKERPVWMILTCYYELCEFCKILYSWLRLIHMTFFSIDKIKILLLSEVRELLV